MAAIDAKRGRAGMTHALWFLSTLALLGSVSGTVLAQRPASVSASKAVCVNAEVDGVRALSYECLSRQLAPTCCPASATASQSAAEALVRGPSNRVGTFNYSAESIRFGNQWGRSATPQRPPSPHVVPLR